MAPFPVTFLDFVTCSYFDSTLLSTRVVCLQFGERVERGGAFLARIAACARVSGFVAAGDRVDVVRVSRPLCLAALRDLR